MHKKWKGLGTTLKLKLLKTCIFPVALYGCEAWTLHQQSIEKINAFEMRCYGKILNISWKQKIKNDNIRKILNIKPNSPLDQVKKQKLKYFGHIKRHDTLERLILEGKVEGERGRKGKTKEAVGK